MPLLPHPAHLKHVEPQSQRPPLQTTHIAKDACSSQSWHASRERTGSHNKLLQKAWASRHSKDPRQVSTISLKGPMAISGEPQVEPPDSQVLTQTEFTNALIKWGFQVTQEEALIIMKAFDSRKEPPAAPSSGCTPRPQGKDIGTPFRPM